MEDYGYQRGEEKGNFHGLVKKIFLISASLFSFSCFLYITVITYESITEDKKEIEIVKSPPEPIKVMEEEGGSGMQIDRSIYEDIFGNKKDHLAKPNPEVKKSLEPVFPTKEEMEKNEAVSNSAQLNAEEKSGKNSAIPKNSNQEKSGKKIIIYNANNQKNEGAKDLLTKEDSENKNAYEAPKKKEESKGKKKIRVQILALSSRNSVQEYWKNINKLHSDIFYGYRDFIEEVDLGKRGIFYRLQIGNFFNQIEAEEFCNRYVSKTGKDRANCIIVE